MTITIYFEDSKKPEGVTIGSMVNGGKVTAIAAYDMFKTMEIAEEALESSDCEICADAMQNINNVIALS